MTFDEEKQEAFFNEILEDVLENETIQEVIKMLVSD